MSPISFSFSNVMFKTISTAIFYLYWAAWVSVKSSTSGFHLNHVGPRPGKILWPRPSQSAGRAPGGLRSRTAAGS